MFCWMALCSGEWLRVPVSSFTFWSAASCSGECFMLCWATLGSGKEVTSLVLEMPHNTRFKVQPSLSALVKLPSSPEGGDTGPSWTSSTMAPQAQDPGSQAQDPGSGLHLVTTEVQKQEYAGR